MSASLRAKIANGLSRVIIQGQSLTEVLPDYDSLGEKDRALARELTFGTLRQYFPLKAVSEQLLKKQLRNRDGNIYCLILVGMYQLFFTRIPDHAAISETVQATVTLNKKWAKGLVNALLRKVLRQGEHLFEIANQDPSVEASLPQWLYHQLKLDWPDQYHNIVQNSHQRAAMTLRINSRHNSLDQYLQKLQKAGITAKTHPLAKQALLLEKSCDIKNLPGYLDGDFSVQDSAPQLAAQLLEVQQGQIILDACAAPGGKTSHILELTNNNASVVAIDRSASRIKRLEENLQRLKVNTRTIVADAINTSDWYSGVAFDRILCDAPCSALGIIRRHPDIAIVRKEADISMLTTIQQQLLDALWPLLKPGGIMLYATCSILKSENSDQISSFLQRHSDAEISDITPKEIVNNNNKDTLPGWQIFPGQMKMDGFYYAKLHKMNKVGT